MALPDNFKARTYWESEDFSRPYQMGAQKHRIYLLDLLKQKGVYNLLDVGCGTGPIYQLIKETWDTTDDGITELPRWKFTYKGTDYSRQMIATAQELFPDGNFEVQDARQLSEKDNSYDCVLLMHALDHLDNYQAAIKEAARVSKKYVCIVLWRGFVNQGTNLNPRNTYGKQEGEAPWEDTYLQEYSKESLEEAFQEAGLVIEEIAEGDNLNSDQSHYNFLYLLRKI